jgi:hypothetical protein
MATAPEPAATEHPGVLGNERLTALAGAVVLVPSAIELITVPALHSLMAVHIFVGVLLAGPVAIKTASTGWRFVRYYTRSPAYRRKGPPRPLLRVLAPLLATSTLALLGSGIALAVAGPAPHFLIRLHVISFLIWVVTLAIHIAAYLPRLPKLIADDWRRRPTQPSPGRGARATANALALAAGTLAAVLLLPTISAWTAWGGANGTKYLLVYAIAALIAATAARVSKRRDR